jgi:hypothetical protein
MTALWKDKQAYGLNGTLALYYGIQAICLWQTSDAGSGWLCADGQSHLLLYLEMTGSFAQ